MPSNHIPDPITKKHLILALPSHAHAIKKPLVSGKPHADSQLTRAQAMYRDADGPTKPVADLNKACAEKPVHLILGGVNDFM